MAEKDSFIILDDVNSTAQAFSVEDTMTDDSYFNTLKSDIIWTGNIDVTDSFISEALRHKSGILASWRQRSLIVRLTPSLYLAV